MLLRSISADADSNIAKQSKEFFLGLSEHHFP